VDIHKPHSNLERKEQSMSHHLRHRFFWSLSLLLIPASAFGATAVLSGPPSRAITDPKSIVSPANSAAREVPVADLFYTRGGLDAAWTPDGKTIVLSTNLTGRYNLWKLSASGGFPLQLTQSDDRQSGIAISPDGKTVVFQSDKGGGEIYDLYSVPIAGGAVTPLTKTPAVSETGAVFSPDGKWIAYDMRLAKAPSLDIGAMDMATGKFIQLTHEASPRHNWKVVGFIEGGRALIANRGTIDDKEAAVYRIDIATGAAKALTPDGPGHVTSATAASADGKTIAVTTETKSGDNQAGLLDVAGRATKLVKPDAWEQRSGSLSPDGKTLVFNSNVDGRTDLFTASSGAVKRVQLPGGVNTEAVGGGSSLSPDGRRLLVTHQASNAPFDYWIADLASGNSRPVTRLGLASINPAALPAAQIVHYKSEDGTVISALLFVPFNLQRDGRSPGIVLPHGGPTGQTVDSFNRSVVALASRGYVVIAPNPRGSTGYGRAFMEANRMDLGGGDLADEVAGAKFMIATGYVDAKKIGITGGSYGGFMTLMAIGKEPSIWAAAVEQFGIINWFSMYDTSAAYLQQYLIGLLGDPVKDKAVYEAASPLTYIRKSNVPLLVLQGDNDIRVPKAQSVEVVDILKGMGRTVDAHYYPGEGHGFTKRENLIDSTERMVAWFDKYLKGK
jgi:dipeptidyl aminopeptidase/acylaminoacyl peptidase